MKLTKILAGACLVTAALLPLSAEAANGLITQNIRMRAGPDSQYPAVTTLPRNARVSIQGCVNGWGWCDVTWKGYRGWVSGQYLEANYNRRNDYIIRTGPQVNVPLIGFSLNNYWDSYYRNHDFYRDRDRYTRLNQDNRHDRNNNDNRGRNNGNDQDHSGPHHWWDGHHWND